MPAHKLLTDLSDRPHFRGDKLQREYSDLTRGEDRSPIKSGKTINDKQWLIEQQKQQCPGCGSLMGNINGSKDAVCRNCGYKDPCCE